MKTRINLIVMVLLLAGQSMWADHNTQQRRNCQGLPKYKAKAKIKPPGSSWVYRSDHGCSNAQVLLSSSETQFGPAGWCPNIGACCYSFVRIGTNGFRTEGRGENGWSWGDDNDYALPEFSYAPMTRKLVKGKKMGSGNGTYSHYFEGGEIIFDEVNHQIIIPNVTANLQVYSQDIANDFTTFEFKVFTETVINGESYPQTTLWRAKASIFGGQLFLEGSFTSMDFTGVQGQDYADYNLGQKTFYIPIPLNVDMSSVVVDLSGDGGNLGIGVSNKYAPNVNTPEGQTVVESIKEATDFNFTLLNDKADQQLEVDITKNRSGSPVRMAEIISLDGKLIKSLGVPENGILTPYDISDLPAGVYILNLYVDDRIYARKFIN